jgi:hypothetical protein
MERNEFKASDKNTSGESKQEETVSWFKDFEFAR